MELVPGLMAGIPCGLLGIVFGSLTLVDWRRRRLVKRVLANPALLMDARVVPPDDTYSVYRLKLTTSRGSKVVAAHADIQRVLPLLEQSGIQVNNAPAWCRDATMAPPDLAEYLDERPGSTFTFIVNGIISPVLMLGLVIATVWSAFVR